MGRLMKGETVQFSNETERDALQDQASLRRSGTRSLLAIPLQDEDQTIGFLSLANLNEGVAMTPEIVQRMHVAADMLAAAMARQSSSKALHESESLKLSLLESMQSSVAVIDGSGTVLEANQQWLNAAPNRGSALRSPVRVGHNYLDACAKASDSERWSAGIRSVLKGTQQSFEVEYEDGESSHPQWYRTTAVRLLREGGGAVLNHLNVTQEKLSELEERRLQEELARVNRAAEMGQMAASLAHELAQPLAAVVSNAQAAAHLMNSAEPDLAEIRSALADIVEDNQRAFAVLNHVRSIVKKYTIVLRPVNLNDIVDSVTVIVRDDAVLRGVQMHFMLSPDEVIVQGDIVPLQQVLLNLVHNAMDAMSQLPAERRILTLKTTVLEPKSSGLLLVEDEGPGISEAMKGRLFSPFVTTKTDGLGMGLVICRTIMQNLGGSILCHDVPGRGTAVHVELPLANWHRV
jgi:C4-dicarboxylate-specific signal transduction histidine kinase